MRWLAVLGAIGISGCVATSEMQLAPNIYRLETNAQGLLFVGQSGKETLRRAAELTIQHGYTHFIFADAGYETGSRIAGVVPGRTYSNATVTGTSYGNTFSGSAYGSSYSTPSTVVRAPTEKVSVTVVMLRAGEPGFEQAFDAETVLKEQER